MSRRRSRHGRAKALTNVVGIPARVHDPVDCAISSWQILYAHYDHLGEQPPGPGNRIFTPGANDNASGDSLAFIEIAKALWRLKPHPRRSVQFLALFGEEEGLARFCLLCSGIR